MHGLIYARLCSNKSQHNAAAIKLRFQEAGKLQILVTQMTWVIGNAPTYKAIEMFPNNYALKPQ